MQIPSVLPRIFCYFCVATRYICFTRTHTHTHKLEDPTWATSLRLCRTDSKTDWPNNRTKSCAQSTKMKRAKICNNITYPMQQDKRKRLCNIWKTNLYCRLLSCWWLASGRCDSLDQKNNHHIPYSLLCMCVSYRKNGQNTSGQSIWQSSTHYKTNGWDMRGPAAHISRKSLRHFFF